ncbi:putative receptor-like protein kinase [Cardamine amara subsp. amara]|uniref:Receptor-like protein kinase n=1 Tax=Cardamine amara subsp. amara TaxID=228776 RepID=A0ABD1AMR1_CARAN
MKDRIFQSEFMYSFLVSPGWKFLRLYFYPTQYNSSFDVVNSFFSVNDNGFTLLQNFNANLTAKGSIPESNSLIKEFIVRTERALYLTFTPSPNSLALVNGIEIEQT